MSTGPEQDTAPSIDPALPEDGIDILRVKSLDKLGVVASANSTQMRALQRRLVGCREDPGQAHLIEPLENAIAIRQQRGIKLVRHRTALQNAENAKKRTAIEEALRPTIGVLNNDRRAVMDHLIDICERVKAAREESVENPHTADQRRYQAKLKLWETTLTAMVLGLDRLPPLPTDME
jgi:hypothetical protein